jgi:riboflavin kinase/FMN adenylyltransferase
LRIEGKLTLPFGVYATQAVFRSKVYSAVTNVGVRPTFQQKDEEPSILVETHFLDQDIDLYGETIEVRFCSHLRGEKKFDGVESLKAQIVKDVAEARSILPS